MFAGMTIIEIIQMLMPLLIVQLVLAIIGIVALRKAEAVQILPKWGWAMVIIFIGIFGPIIFFIFGREKDV